MASSYPGALDSLTNPASGDAMNSGDGHAAQHADANDAIEAIQATLGTDPQGGEATVDARLTAIESGGSGIPSTIVDAKGDLLVATGADTVARLAVGANRKVVAADSGQTEGVKWAGDVALIDPAHLSISAQSAVNFDSIFTSAHHLYRVVIIVAGSSGTQALTLQLRNAGSTESGSNYSRVAVQPHYTTALTGADSIRDGGAATTSWNINRVTTDVQAWVVEIVNPAHSGQTSMFYRGSDANVYGTHGVGKYTGTGTYDGLRLAIASGTMTGDIWCVPVL